MDRSKWEYKKLGEVCTMYQPKTISTQELVDDGDYLVYGANGVIGRYDKFNHEQSEILMTCRGATCGTINISEPFSWINGNAMVIHPANNDFVRDFLVYQLKAVDKSSVITGAAQPQITRQMLQTLPVVKAPISDQQRIVAELDCLNEMIAVKQEQLKEFDKLAQSIFYDMFGDPVANEKKIEKYSLGKIAVFKNGLNFKPVDEGNSIRILGVSDFQDLKEIKTADSLSLKCIKETVDDDYYLKNGDIVIVRSNGSKKLVGRNVLIRFEDKNVAYSGFCIRCRLTSDDCLPLYLNFVLSTPSMKELMTFGGRGCNIANINQQALNRLPIPLPPLSLQQQFADKISAIEAQKELVKQSIAETQQLFNSKMDYYFND